MFSLLIPNLHKFNIPSLPELASRVWGQIKPGPAAAVEGAEGASGAGPDPVVESEPPPAYAEAEPQNVCIASSSAGPSNRLFSMAGGTSTPTIPAAPNAKNNSGIPEPESEFPVEWGRSQAPQSDSFAEQLYNEGLVPRPGQSQAPQGSSRAGAPEGTTEAAGPPTEPAPPPEDALPEGTGEGIRPPVQPGEDGFWKPAQRPGDGIRPPAPPKPENGEPGEGDLDLNIPPPPRLPNFGTLTLFAGAAALGAAAVKIFSLAESAASVPFLLWDVTKKSACEDNPASFCAGEGNPLET